MSRGNGEANLEKDLPAPPSESGAYEYEELRVYHEQIIRLKALTARKITYEEIADAVGCTKQTVYNVLNSKIGQAKLQMLKEHADAAAKGKMEKIGELADYGLAVKEKLLMDPNTSAKLRDKIATDLLDRTGAKKAEKHKHEHEFTKERMKDIKERARASATVVESKPIEDEEEDD